MDAPAALPRSRDPRRVSARVGLHALALGDPVQGLEVERRVRVARLAYAVGVVLSAGDTVGEDEDAVRGYLDEEVLEAEAVVGAACLAPEYDGELQVGGDVRGGKDGVVA